MMMQTILSWSLFGQEKNKDQFCNYMRCLFLSSLPVKGMVGKCHVSGRCSKLVGLKCACHKVGVILCNHDMHSEINNDDQSIDMAV